MPERPVIFLAFANEQNDQTRYLRGLAKEQILLKEALESAVDADLCELIVESNASVKSIINTFQKKKYRDRIAIFHYGGHADGYQLLLESIEGENVVAHGEGLVSFFSKQKGLRLIFLNGCSTQQQAMDLVKAGIPAVIGTSSSIDDDIATRLAVRFYSSVGQGNSIDRAWKESEDEVRMTTGTSNTRSLYFKAIEAVPDRFPWEIYFREGAEIIRNWNLPDAGDNPLFGLPAIPATYQLPDEPFRFLRRYEREQARLFFGRSYYIHTLYKQVTDPNGPAVILLHGQSGVGKSSLLDAGLLPRLEEAYEVISVRRDQEKGLLGTFQEALGVSQKQLNLHQLTLIANDFDEKTQAQFEDFIEKLKGKEVRVGLDAISFSDEELNRFIQLGSLFQVWQEIEAKTGKPLIVILDQVEEMYTRPMRSSNEESISPFAPPKDQKDEFRPFLRVIQSMFDQQTDRLKGKLVLSYRKEYHPDIEEEFRQLQIPRSTVFLEQLSEKDLLEVIRAYVTQSALLKKYNIQTDELLAETIAADLVQDPDSPVAPVFQIILSKLWEMGKKQGLVAGMDHEVRFSMSNYLKLQDEGIQMRDFYRQQMVQLRIIAEKIGHADIIDSGLALDLLHYHVTDLGTAGSHRMQAVRDRYIKQQEKIDTLLEECADLSLLYQIDEATRTMLAHDTLAPIIELEYNESDKPTQRATRIMSAKMADRKALTHQEKERNTSDVLNQVFLDEVDLSVVESAMSAMPLFSEEEEELISISRQKRTERQAARRRNRTIQLSLLTMLVLGSIIFAIFQNRSAEKIRVANTDRSNKNMVRAAQEIEHLNYDEAFLLLNESLAFNIAPEGASGSLAELAYIFTESQQLAKAKEVLTVALKSISGSPANAVEAQLSAVETALADSDTFAIQEQLLKAVALLGGEEQLQELAARYYPSMIQVEGGFYLMGTDEPSAEEEQWAVPAHPVSVDNFELGKHEVTVAQYKLFCMATGREMPEPTATHWIASHPIVAISWHAANAYCEWLTEKTGIMHRLPTEAEWEFAARGGIQEDTYVFAGGDSLSAVAWHNENTNYTKPIGTREPNSLGLHDMSGNVQEWCADWFGRYPEDGDFLENPPGPENPMADKSGRVARGGSWESPPLLHRVTFRQGYDPNEEELVVVGFRCWREWVE